MEEEKMNDDNKSIKCDVEGCIYNDSSTNYCTLNEIKVSYNNNSKTKKETLCDSFKKRNS
ncbi:MAG: DUF1540 domain-containing protein [Bacilli bacterium]|nr:DUF1540 domain-containing protein [Bacilli bacterium]